MKFVIQHPLSRGQERRYAIEVVFAKFLGIEFVCYPTAQNHTVIFLNENPGAGKLIVRDGLFSLRDSDWLKLQSLPRLPLDIWRDDSTYLRDAGVWPLPILYGEKLANGQYYVERDCEFELGVDIFGSIFFMLTRYEEMVIDGSDQFGRFPATQSIAYQQGFLDRPLVDEYVELLLTCMKRIWPGIRRKQHTYRFYLSHDVDHPLSNIRGSLFRAMRKAGGDLINGRGIRSALNRFYTAYRNSRGDYQSDPNNTFGFLMDVAEQHGLRSAFYFIAGKSAGAIDGDYSIDMPWIRTLMKHVSERGHEIGLHPSFNSYLDGSQLSYEFRRLLKVCDLIGVKQNQWGGRQHYLRWKVPFTWSNWEKAGLDYDTTVGFADHVGFRTGTCREYPVFDLRKGATLNLIERSLIVMEGTLLTPQYMNLSPDEALEWIGRLAQKCRRFDGNFTLLWHNCMLGTPVLRRLFREAVSVAS